MGRHRRRHQVQAAGAALALSLGFAAGVLPPSVTHARTGPATIYDAGGALAFAPHNFLKYSADLDNAAWSKLLATVTPNVALMPDGTQTMDKIVATAVAGNHYLSQPFVFTGIGIHSFYARAGEWPCIGLANSPNNYVYFNLTNGSVSSLGNGWGDAGMVDMGGGLWRCWAKNSAAQTWGQVQTIIVSSFIADGNTGPACLGDGTSGVYAGGLQFQQVAQETVPGVYVPTGAAAVYGPRFTFDPVALTMAGLLVEPARTNLLLNNAALSTQSVAVTAQPYVLSFYGSGSVTLSGAASGVVAGLGAYPARQTFVILPTAGTLTLTVSGAVQFAQLEAGWLATMPIVTYAAAQTRAADVLSLTIPAAVTDVRYLFGDGAAQDIAVTAGAYTVPTALDRFVIRSIKSAKQYKTVIYRSNFASGWAVNQYATLSQDAVNTTIGGSSLSLVTTATGSGRAQITGLNLDLSAPDAWFRLRFHVPPWATPLVGTIEVALFDATGKSRFFYVWYPSHGRGGPNDVAFPVNVSWDWQTGITPELPAGIDPNMGAITKIIVGVAPVSAAAANVIFDEICCFTPSLRKGRIMVGGDGSTTGQGTVADWMTPRGLPFTFYTSPNYLNYAGRLSDAQLAAKKLAGHFVACYAGSYYVPLWVDLTNAEKLDIITRVQAWANASGYSSGARYLSVSGNAGVTLDDAQRLVGSKLSMIMGSADGSQYQHAMRGGPFAAYSWFGGQINSERKPVMSFAALAQKIYDAKGTLVYLSHIFEIGDDTSVNVIANLQSALDIGFDFITPEAFVREGR